LNGKLIEEKAVSDSTKLTAKFEVPYESGELKATGIENGKAVAIVILTTTNVPKRIRLIPDKKIIHANRNDLSYVIVEIVDDKNNVVPYANIPVQFSVNGAGEIAAVGNANPSDMASFKQPKRNTFKGRCLVILRPDGKVGDIILEAKAEGLEPAKISVKTK